MIDGIDVSNWQGAIDWPAVAGAGYVFAFAKASEGVSFRDPTFTANWAGMQAAGIARGAYHYARPSVNSPDTEAAWFLSVVRPMLGPGDVTALDLEDPDVPPGTDLLAWVQRWIAVVCTTLGAQPMLYSGVPYLEDHNCLAVELSQNGLWLASWQATKPPTPDPWPFIAIWQHADDGTVAGISGNVDLDIFYGTVEQFRAYGQPAVVPAKPVPTNDDLEQLHRLVDAQPFVAADLIAYAQRFA